MRHALLLIVASVIAYVAWSMADKKERRRGMNFITRHGVRLLAILAVVFLLLAAAVILPSSGIF